jgi:hypothetical protein
LGEVIIAIIPGVLVVFVSIVALIAVSREGRKK